MPSRGNYRSYGDNFGARSDQYQPSESWQDPRRNYKQQQKAPPPYSQTRDFRGGGMLNGGYNGYNQGSRFPNEGLYPNQQARVGFESDPRTSQKKSFEQVQNSKNRTKLCMLIIVAIFLAAATALGGVATAMRPWWKQTKAEENYDWIEVGLWEACKKKTKGSSWICNSYDDTDVLHKSGYKDMGLMQKLMIAGSACAGLTFVFIFVAILARKTAMFRALLYTIGFLSAACAGLFGTCIGYLSDQKKSSNILPSFISTVDVGDLDFAMMFFLACAAAGSAFLALVFSAVILFISDDYDLDELEDAEYEDDYPDAPPGKTFRQTGQYPQENLNDGNSQAFNMPHLMYPPKQQYDQYDEKPRRKKHRDRRSDYSGQGYKHAAYDTHQIARPAVISKEYDPYPTTSNNQYKEYSVHSSRQHHKHRRSHHPDSRNYLQNDMRAQTKKHQQSHKDMYDDYEVYFNSPY